MAGTGASSSEIGLNTVAPGGDAVTPEVDEMFSTIDAPRQILGLIAGVRQIGRDHILKGHHAADGDHEGWRWRPHATALP
jgi:hypothetical protein